MKNKYSHYRSDEEDGRVDFERIRNRTERNNWKKNEKKKANDFSRKEKSFKCLQCGSIISTEREDSGVNNRNHCPYCLWSRHVDLDKAGDRKAECRSRMEPVGLTVKRVHKQYDRNAAGELMAIHRCAGCGKISINRIAADDDPAQLWKIFESSQILDEELIRKLEATEVALLRNDHRAAVYVQLFGWQSVLDGLINEQKLTDQSAIEQTAEISVNE